VMFELSTTRLKAQQAFDSVPILARSTNRQLPAKSSGREFEYVEG